MQKTDVLSHPMIAAVRTEKDLAAAIESPVQVLFLQQSNIITLKETVQAIHEAGKLAFVHVDFADGIAKDRTGLQYIKNMGVDGIGTTRTNVVKMAKNVGLIAVQRFFMIDSRSVQTSLDSMRIANPDLVELMPGVLLKKIKEILEVASVPVIAGGLVETEEEVRSALASGISFVSTGNTELWDLNV